VERCDQQEIARRTVEVAAGRCAAWCTEKSCGTASFVPPPGGCVATDCYRNAEDCPAERCPLREYCSLPDTQRVWNCLCRDVIAP
jgi:hypothetical protein